MSHLCHSHETLFRDTFLKMLGKESTFENFVIDMQSRISDFNTKT